VSPGSADLPAGAIVTIRGSGFTPRTKLQLGDPDPARVEFVDSTELRVTLGSAGRMHGMRVRARDARNERVTYYSYQRTTRSGSSTNPDLARAVPVFPAASALDARVPTAAATALAVQNISPGDALVVAELVAADDTVLGSAEFTLPSNQYVLHLDAELFGVSTPAATAMRVRASSPVQVMGVALGPDGALTPVPPR
jgi:hypothetical protein